MLSTSPRTSTCGTCNSTHYIVCPECGGNRVVRCLVCKGRGTDTGGHRCTNCAGDGLSSCMRCHCAGEIACPSCNHA